MFVFTFNKKKGTKLVFIAFFAVVAVALCAFIGLQQRDGIKTYATCDELGTYSTEAPDEEAQAKFLRSLGIKVEPEAISSDEITVPTVFDDVYNAYNELQATIGLDLTPFKGQEIERVVFRIKKSDKTATLLIYKGHVVGGHISSGVFGDSYEPLVAAQ